MARWRNPFVSPDIALENRNSHKVGHNLGKAFVVVAFHPNDLDIAFAIGEFADAGEKLPMIAVQAGEVEVGEDVAQKNQTAEVTGLEQRDSISSAADIGPEVNI